MRTESKDEAQRRAAILEARWRAEIERARTQSSDHVERDAEFWRNALKEAPAEQREAIVALIADEAQDMVERAATRAGIVDHRDAAYDDLPEHETAGRFYALATGKAVKLSEHLEEWLVTVNNEPKAKDMKRTDVLRFAKLYPYVHDARRKEVQQWVNRLTQDGKKPATVARILSALRGYWKYLTSIEVASENALPFDNLSIPRRSIKEIAADERKPFKPEEVVKLLNETERNGDNDLADLIRLGMWTGARIEELCALKVEKVGKDAFEIEDAKTQSGHREVPIHSKLKAAMKRLVKDSKDGYVLSGLTLNKYGDRSNAIGKRFGRLKTSMGFGEDRVFHSIRRTVATLLENASVPENVSVDILGHEKPTMTYGLYSGGATLAVKRAAIEKIGYPGVA